MRVNKVKFVIYLTICCSMMLILLLVRQEKLKTNNNIESKERNLSNLENGKTTSSEERDHNFFVDVPKLKSASNPVISSYQSNDDDSQVRFVRDLYDERWRISSDQTCRNKSGILFVAAVISAPDHFKERQAIRQSWGRYAKQWEDTALIFVLGHSDQHLDDLMREAKEHQDIAMSHMPDTFQNLSLKTLSAFMWLESFCEEAKFLLKVDDDVFIQMPRLKTLLKGFNSVKDRRDKAVILGNVATGWKPGRVVESKYYISPQIYNETFLPSFVTGPSYVVSSSAIEMILDIAWDEKYMFLEDVFVTGIMAEKVGVPRQLVLEFKNNAERIPARFLGCTLLRTISIHKVLPEEHMELLKASRSPQCGGQKVAARP